MILVPLCLIEKYAIIDSGNGLVLQRGKQLPEPNMTLYIDTYMRRQPSMCYTFRIESFWWNMIL